MTKNILLSVFLLVVLRLSAIASPVTVCDLRVENMTNPLGIDVRQPRFSWRIETEKQDVSQTAYHLLVASSREKLDRGEGDFWDSGDVRSSRQLWIAYDGKKLPSDTRLFWKVRIETNKGNSDWSETAMASIGLLTENDWKGRWIGMEELQDGDQRGLHVRLAPRYLRKEYSAKGPVKRATAYVGSFGLYQFFINGQRVGGNQVLSPVPSDFRKTIYYNTFDVTTAIQTKTALGVILAAGRVFPMRQEKYYKAPVFGLPKCRINIIVEYQNGTKEVWTTDQTWKISASGPLRNTNEYDGEEYDARKQFIGWTQPGYDDKQWELADRASIPTGTLMAQPMPNMVETEFGHPKTVQRLGQDYILDFGQNMAGWVGFKVQGKPGDTIRVKYAERLKPDGSLYRDNLRNALSEDIYVCDGNENGIQWRPSFTYHGFRYVEMSGLKVVRAEDFTAYIVGDDMRMTGTLSTSDTTLNKVLKNAFWGIKSNYKGMPVDCPQRNERQPWLGDRTVGCWGESYLFENERLYAKWMHDMCDGQRSDGAMSNVTPAFWNYYDDNVTWPAVFPFACEMLYEQYGNVKPIADSYPYIKKWFCHILDEYEKDGIITKDTYGDWCLPPEKLELIHSQDPSRQTDGSLISTAYGIKITDQLARFAHLLQLPEDENLWKDKRQEMTTAFNRHFLTVKHGTSPRPGHVLYPDSVFYGNNTATANVLPLAFGIVPDSVKEEVVKNLVNNIMTVGNGHVTCGVIGISWLLRGLSDNGFSDVAWLLATNNTYPSWGYMADNGATTIWELWNGDKANPEMNSGNHVMLLGDLLTWCYQYIAGIRQTSTAYASSATDETAYRHLVLKPSFDIQDCFQVDASYHTPYGLVESRWKKTLQQLHWEVAIPANTTADIYFPDGTKKNIGSGRYVYDCKIPTTSAAILEDEFLYENASFPEAHASTITEQKNGDLVAAYFGGTKERNPDVCIWVSRKKKGSNTWDKPILAGDGVFELGSEQGNMCGVNEKTTDASVGPVIGQFSGKTMKRKACWNPVLFTLPNGEILLFYKVGLSVSDWQGCMVRSTDGGKTWSKREMLPKGYLGPVKNKPILMGRKLICGSSTEVGGWKFHVEILDLDTKQWKYVGPVTADSALATTSQKRAPIDCIQPSLLKLKDGRIKVLMRTRNGRLAASYSSDGGYTWTPVTLTDVPNNQSGTDAVTLRDGRHVLIYNDFETIMGTPKGPRTPLSIAVSDDGDNWRHVLTLEDSPISQYSYPAIIEGRDGMLHCVYTWRRQRIVYKKIDLDLLR